MIDKRKPEAGDLVLARIAKAAREFQEALNDGPPGLVVEFEHSTTLVNASPFTNGPVSRVTLPFFIKVRLEPEVKPIQVWPPQ